MESIFLPSSFLNPPASQFPQLAAESFNQLDRVCPFARPPIIPQFAITPM
jgi:hypothetical protein